MRPSIGPGHDETVIRADDAFVIAAPVTWQIGADLPPRERDTAIAEGREFSVETAVAMALIAIGTHRARAGYAGTLTLAGTTPLARTPSRS